MPGTQVPTLSGQQVLDQDPGAASGRVKPAERWNVGGARGGLLSGGTCKPCKRGRRTSPARSTAMPGRMMEKSREQYGRDWGQYQQQWNQGVTGTELGLRTKAQNFGQAEAASGCASRSTRWRASRAGARRRRRRRFGSRWRSSPASRAGIRRWQGQQNQFTQGLQSAAVEPGAATAVSAGTL